MGIVIGYKGSLNNPAQVDVLLDDMRHCATKLGWPCQDISYPVSGLVAGLSGPGNEESPPQLVEEEIHGILIQPPDTETLTLTFNREGKLIQYMEIPRQLLVNPQPDETYYLESTPWVKTTGQMESHFLILVLLRRIRNRYMTNLEIRDDTGFWETGDFEKLRSGHSFMSSVVSTFRDPHDAQALLTSLGEESENLQHLDPAFESKQPLARKRAATRAN